MNPLIEFKQVDLGPHTKITNLDLKVYSKDKIVFTGPSGIGKTSLFKAFLGLTDIKRGGIYFQGKKIEPKNIWEVRQKIAYVDQDVSFPEGYIKDFFEYVFSLKANKKLNLSQEEIKDTLNFFELSFSILDKKSEAVSGGERQRLALCIALLLKRDIFFLDEVTSSLDKSLKVKVIDYFLNNPNFTVLAISHDLEWLNHHGVKIINLG